jgi:pyruvate/2-oxoglutarate dehydrogenase complex dihydrolipoamide acyltransferase (E2) component
VVTALGKDEVVPIVGIRKAMSKAMTRAQQIPHFGYDDEVRVAYLHHYHITALILLVQLTVLRTLF